MTCISCDHTVLPLNGTADTALNGFCEASGSVSALRHIAQNLPRPTQADTSRLQNSRDTLLNGLSCSHSAVSFTSQNAWGGRIVFNVNSWGFNCMPAEKSNDSESEHVRVPSDIDSKALGSKMQVNVWKTWKKGGKSERNKLMVILHCRFLVVASFVWTNNSHSS